MSSRKEAISKLGRSGRPNHIRLHTANGFGSTDTAIRRFSVQQERLGTSMTNDSTAANGTRIRILKSGIYSFTYSDNAAVSSAKWGLTLNSTQLTAAFPLAVAVTDHLAYDESLNENGAGSSLTWTGYLKAGDVVRPHTNKQTVGDPSATLFTAVRIS